MQRKAKFTLTIIGSILLLVLLGSRVVSTVRWPSEGEYTGTVTYSFESQDFQPDKSFEHWWFQANPEALWPCAETLSKESSLVGNNIVMWGVQYHVKVQGKLSPKGRFGHEEHWKRQLSVDQIIECEVEPMK